MWFDARAKLAEIMGHPPATIATIATKAPAAPPVSQVSQVSQHPKAPKPQFMPPAAPPVSQVSQVSQHPKAPKPQFMPPARADGLEPDSGAYLDRLRLHGAATYGAMATALGWAATRAWQAEAKLRALGLVMYRDGKAAPMEKGTT